MSPPPPPRRTPNLRFGYFLQLGGSKWTEIVLYEQGVPLGRSGHPTCLNLTQNGATKLKELGPNSPFGALAAEMEAQYDQVSSFNILAMWPTQLDQPVAVGPKSGPPRLPKDLRGPQKGLSEPKRALLGAPGVP